MERTSVETDALLGELRDREEIRELTYRYGLAIEQRDENAMAELFTEDGAADFSSLGWGVIRGRAALRDFYRTTWPLDVKPFFSNHLIELAGDRARGTCSLENRATRDGQSMIGAGRLHDEYQRVDGGWKFASRRVEMFYFTPLARGWGEGGAAAIHNPTGIAAPIGHYSHGVEVPPGARLLHTAGQVGIDAAGQIPVGIEAQTEVALRNIAAILESAGMAYPDVIHVRTYLVDLDDFPGFRDVRAKVLGAHKPASTLVVVKGLVLPELRVEIECVAAKV
jgi:2-iminobutanoate/2-iminopropanoate deaminase